MSKKKNRKQEMELLKPQVGGIARAADWPVYEVLVSKNWQEEASLVSVLIARRSPITAKIACALLLVDMGCLGVKSAQVKLFKNVAEYTSGLRSHALSLQPMENASFNLAAKIVYTGLEYAAALGFKPDAVFNQAEPLLHGADPDACELHVPTGGPEGKPFYVNGPYDNPRRIIDQLTRSVGPNNFHYLIQGSAEDLGIANLVERDDLPWEKLEDKQT